MPDGYLSRRASEVANLFEEGRYVVERELGRGGMAIVYLAEDQRHRRKVAIKVLHPELTSAVATERFLREIQLTAGLTHPHILPLYESGETAGVLYYIMPYVDGESLRELLDREKQLPVDEAVALAREVADALSYAHANNLLHRDVKPENILLQTGHAVVADFGIARALTAAGGDRLTETGITVGTPAYMSPEQATGESVVDERSDVYSLGCVLYEMLVGEPPFTGANAQIIMARHAVEPVPSLRTARPDLPEGLERVVRKALAKSPADRYASAQAFSMALTRPATIERSRLFSVARGAVATATLVALSLVGWWTVERFFLSQPDREMVTIAVLPFANLTGDSASVYLSDGLTDEIASALAQLNETRVASRTSTYQFKDEARDVREIGGRLDVDYIVEGSVRGGVRGEDLTVTAQLTDIESGHGLWSNRYGRRVGEILTLRSDIAGAIAAELRLTADTQNAPLRRGTQNDEAYVLYLRARHQLYRYDEEGWRNSITLFEEAIGLDPRYAAAYAGLADAYYGLSGAFVPSDEVMPKARAAAQRAIELDPNLAEAHTAMGIVAASFDWDWDAAERSYRRAIDLNPSSAVAYHYLGLLLVQLGRFEEAAEVLTRAQELDPLSLSIEVTAAWPPYYGGQYEEAIDRLNRTIQFNPEFYPAFYVRAMAYMASNRHAEALESAERLAELLPEPEAEAVHALAQTLSGDSAQARNLLEVAETMADSTYLPPNAIIWLHTALGEHERAIDVLEECYDGKEWYLTLIKVDPLLDPLRPYPRFSALLRKMDLD